MTVDLAWRESHFVYALLPSGVHVLAPKSKVDSGTLSGHNGEQNTATAADVWTQEA